MIYKTVDCVVNNAISLYSLINGYIYILKISRLFWRQNVSFLFSLNDFIENKKLSCENLHNYYCLHYTVYVWLHIWIYVMWYRPQTQKGILTSQVRFISLSVYLGNTCVTWHVLRTTYGPTIKSIDVYDCIKYLEIILPLQAFPSLK